MHFIIWQLQLCRYLFLKDEDNWLLRLAGAIKAQSPRAQCFFFWQQKTLTEGLDFIHLHPKQCTAISFPKGKEIDSRAFLALHLEALLHKREHLEEDLCRKAFLAREWAMIHNSRNVLDLARTKTRSAVEKFCKDMSDPPMSRALHEISCFSFY